MRALDTACLDGPAVGGGKDPGQSLVITAIV